MEEQMKSGYGDERIDAQYVIKQDLHSGPRNEEEAKLLRDPVELQKSLLANFKWDADDESTEVHPSFEFLEGVLTDLSEMFHDLMANLSARHYEATYFRYPIDLNKYPAINDIVTGAWNDDSKTVVMEIVCAAFTGMSLDEAVLLPIEERVNELINVSEKHRLRYAIRAMKLHDDPVSIMVTDTTSIQEESNRERVYVEILLQNASNKGRNVERKGV